MCLSPSLRPHPLPADSGLHQVYDPRGRLCNWPKAGLPCLFIRFASDCNQLRGHILNSSLSTGGNILEELLQTLKESQSLRL
ncbi:hypothetical protein SKAU_G00219650 [Synaphobranchus kaupii]|uniref:Uncharacterized protein n=1 Tax=Synaphobranchus kaupii TaxID=118154 RepID=A0A9Q1FAI8_SYNKA|nr:hypothetical protein SKAU_G00219650 [Synaphobranchus kaupii]